MSIGVKETMLIVGGTFDDNGGKLSSVVNQIMAAMLDESFDVKLYNGGSFDQVESILEECKYFDYILWWANVPNDKPKLRNVKEINPKAMLVTSKRNDDNKYSFAELINRALGAKANLCVQFSKVNDPVISFVHKFAGISQNGTTEISVFLYCKLSIKTAGKFQ